MQTFMNSINGIVCYARDGKSIILYVIGLIFEIGCYIAVDMVDKYYLIFKTISLYESASAVKSRHPLITVYSTCFSFI